WIRGQRSATGKFQHATRAQAKEFPGLDGVHEWFEVDAGLRLVRIFGGLHFLYFFGDVVVLDRSGLAFTDAGFPGVACACERSATLFKIERRLSITVIHW